jgi:polygalacturonase
MPFLVTDFGARGDGATSATVAIQKAIDAAAERGGGTVVVPAGRYVTGTIWLRSNINLNLEPGATLLGAQDVNEFPVWTPAWEGVKSHAPLIGGENLDNVSVTGRGTIDGRGQMWWELMRKLDSTAATCSSRA